MTDKETMRRVADPLAAHIDRNWASAGIANAITPETDQFWFTPAQIARHRLRAVVRADREACPTGRWVDRSLVDVVGIDKDGRWHFAAVGKPRYRWEVRR